MSSDSFVPSSFKVVGKKEGNCAPEDVEGKIAEGQRLKSLGNERFKEKEYKKALAEYNKSLMYVSGLVSVKDDTYQYGNATNKLSEQQEAIVTELKSSVYLNMSQIDLFMKNYQKCVERTTKALTIKQSAKGHYRRGIARIELNDFDSAREDFNKCKQLDPSTAVDIANKITLLAAKEKQEDKKSSKFYSKMFSSSWPPNAYAVIFSLSLFKNIHDQAIKWRANRRVS